jgi:hypothetical protein
MVSMDRTVVLDGDRVTLVIDFGKGEKRYPGASRVFAEAMLEAAKDTPAFVAGHIESRRTDRAALRAPKVH